AGTVLGSDAAALPRAGGPGAVVAGGEPVRGDRGRGAGAEHGVGKRREGDGGAAAGGETFDPRDPQLERGRAGPADPECGNLAGEGAAAAGMGGVARPRARRQLAAAVRAADGSGAAATAAGARHRRRNGGCDIAVRRKACQLCDGRLHAAHLRAPRIAVGSCLGDGGAAGAGARISAHAWAAGGDGEALLQEEGRRLRGMSAAGAAALMASPRRKRVIGLGILFAAMLVVLFAPQAWSLHFQPSPQNAWLLFVLSALGFLGTVTLALILMRQMVKLYAERRAQVLGAQFKTKLVIGALALSLTPVICMFGFTYGLINRTLDKWFSQPVQTVRDDNQSTLNLLTQFVADNAQAEATLIAGSPDLGAGLRGNRWGEVGAALARHKTTLAEGFAAVLDPGGRVLASVDLPAGYHPPAGGAAEPVAAGPRRVMLGGRPYLMARARLSGTGMVEVGMPI